MRCSSAAGRSGGAGAAARQGWDLDGQQKGQRKAALAEGNDAFFIGVQGVRHENSQRRRAAKFQFISSSIPCQR
jgi:hypothetical protein